MPDTHVHLISTSMEPIESEYGLCFEPNQTIAECPQLDVLFVPGGKGINLLIESDKVREFLQRQALKTKFVTSVCTGALVLGAAGLLKGYRATTHWLSMDLLPLVGAIPVRERVVVDRNRITGGGVTAGIDFGFVLAAKLFGQSVAEEIQLMMEYDPSPPFNSGTPSVAAEDLVKKVTNSRKGLQGEREKLLRSVLERKG